MNSLKGHLLVATPRLVDPNFARTVLLMFEHTEEGAAAVVLNRPTDATIEDISGQIFQEHLDWDKPIHLGGPVPGPLMVIHTIEGLADQEITPGLYTSIEAAKVREIIRQKAEPSLVVANYAGWGPGQLEGEIDENSWLSLPATVEHVFRPGEEDLWDAVVKEASASQLTRILGLRGVPDDPSMN